MEKRKKESFLLLIICSLLLLAAGAALMEQRQRETEMQAQGEGTVFSKLSTNPEGPEREMWLYADLDGDGTDDEIGLIYGQSNQLCLYPSGGGEACTYALGSFQSLGVKMHAGELDRSGGTVLVLDFDMGGSGGVRRIYPFVYDGVLRLLPVPVKQAYSETEYDCGYTAAIEYLDDFKVYVVCPDTGLAATVSLHPDDREEYLAREWYNGQGMLLKKDAWAETDSVGEAGIKVIGGEAYLQISQYIWGMTHPAGIVRLVSTLYWEDGTLVLAQQELVPEERL